MLKRFENSEAIAPENLARVRAQIAEYEAAGVSFSSQEVESQVALANKKMRYNHLSKLRKQRFAPSVSDDDIREYQRLIKIPRSLIKAVSNAAWKSAPTRGAIGRVQKELRPLRDKLEKLEEQYKGQNEALENATVEAAKGYYPNYPALEASIAGYFDYLRDQGRIDAEIDRIKGEKEAIAQFKAREAQEAAALDSEAVFDEYQREQDYLKGLLDGTIEPYIGEPGEQQEYRQALEGYVGPAAAAVRKILDNKPAPNLRDSGPAMNFSAHEVEAQEALIKTLDSRTTHGDAQALLKLAGRSASFAKFKAAVAAQKMRRLAGARGTGYLELGTDKETLGDLVLQALTVLREADKPTVTIDGKEVEIVDWLVGRTFDEIVKFARDNNLRLPTEAYVEKVPEAELVPGGPEWRYKDDAPEVADILTRYRKTRKNAAEDLQELIKLNDTFYKTALEFVNEVSGEEWIPEFRKGHRQYALHQYDVANLTKDQQEIIHSEETARILARSEAALSYVSAALNTGRFAKTLNAADLIESWDTTVNAILRHRILFRGLAKLTDAFGNALLIPAVPKNEEEGNVPGTLLEPQDAERILASLLASARLYYKWNQTPTPFTWKRNMSDTPFGALNDLLTYLTERDDQNNTMLDTLGYTKVTADNVFGLRNQSFWVAKGPAAQAVKHLIEPGIVKRASQDGDWRYKSLAAIIKFNRLIKTLNVGFSLFHHFALIESWLADTGGTPKAVVRAMQNLMTSKSDYMALFSEESNAAKWVLAGLQIQATPLDVDLNILDNGLKKLSEKFDQAGLPWIGTGVRGVTNLKKAADNFLWHNMLPVMKVQMAERALADAKRSGVFPGLPDVDTADKDKTPSEKLAEAAMMDDIAKYVNDALGTQEWEQYLWATPMARDVMNVFIYAPDWTLSALNISGVPEMGVSSLSQAKWLGYDGKTDFAQWRRSTRYLPGFFMWVFLALPTVLQASITAAYGDDDDKLFPWENEKGKKFAANISPLIRHAAKQKGIEPPTRQTYVQAGKQVKEVIGWLKDPVGTAFGKSSASVRIPITATTGVISPSMKTADVWSARNDEDKWAKVLGNMLPFAFSSLKRQEIWGGAVGTVLTVSMPRTSGVSGYATAQEVGDALTNFAEDRDVQGLAPAVAKAALDTRILDLKDAYMRQGASEKEWKEALQAGASMARGKVNKQLRDEYMKGPGKIDGEKVGRLLIASNLLYKSNSEARKRLEQGILDSMRLSEKRRAAPQKIANLKAKTKGANQQDIRDVAAGVNESGAGQFRASSNRLRRL